MGGCCGYPGGAGLSGEAVGVVGRRSRFPSHRFVGEETTGQEPLAPLTDEPTWMVDPLDGTTNFVHSFPHCAVSIGLCVRREPVVGVVVDPLRQESFVARRGHGLTLNGRPVRQIPARIR